MKLPEKIIYCRKKAGLTQEALAEQISVSRQSISKWETGDAAPEIGKLLLLANAFDVTTDWLLSDQEPAETQTEQPSAGQAVPAAKSTWVDAMPGMIGRMLRRYGWLAGVYMAVSGALFTGLGALTRALVRSMNSNAMFSSFPGDAMVLDPYGTQLNSSLTGTVTGSNPVSIMGAFIMGLGIIMLIAGVILAVVLKSRGQHS